MSEPISSHDRGKSDPVGTWLVQMCPQELQVLAEAPPAEPREAEPKDPYVAALEAVARAARAHLEELRLSGSSAKGSRERASRTLRLEQALAALDVMRLRGVRAVEEWG
jgi:hypothetical protein